MESEEVEEDLPEVEVHQEARRGDVEHQEVAVVEPKEEQRQ